MPTKSRSPGLAWRTRADGTRIPYWVATNVVRNPKGYPDKTVRLPSDADAEEIAETCSYHTAKLMAWLGKNIHPDADESGVRTIYDRRFLSLSRIFQEHRESSFNSVKKSTRDFYFDSLKIIERDIPKRNIAACTIVDAKRWYRIWSDPASPGEPRRIKRAHDAVSMVRMICRFGAALGYSECESFVAKLEKVRFEKPESRTEEMTYLQAAAFIRTALNDNRIDMAIAVAAQFELMLRQKDVIGEWAPAVLKTPGAIYDNTGQMWLGPFRWDNIPGWKLRMRTSKTRAGTTFNLEDYPLLFPLLEAVPHAERVGAIVTSQTGLPFRYTNFRKTFRAIARKAEIPDTVWNMDARAGGATEADEAGAEISAIQDHLTHANPQMTARYIRGKSTRKKSILAAARARHREQE